MARRKGTASSPRMKEFVRAATRAGWEVSMTNGNHIRFRSPDGKQSVFTGSSPSDSAAANLRAQLRKAGLDI